nr:phage integrase N-terminal SAM-like domain-containing protein [Ideonella sp. B508-1]
MPLKSPRVLGQLRERLRFLHDSPRTEEAYVHWIRAFVRFHRLRHPAELGGGAVRSPLDVLARAEGWGRSRTSEIDPPCQPRKARRLGPSLIKVT